MKKTIFTTLAFLFFALPSSSDETPPHEKYDCNNPKNTIELNWCKRKAYENSDKKLNEVYVEVINEADPKRKQLLKNAQRAWIKFRDTNCDYFRDLSRDPETDISGSIQYYLYFSCLERVTRERTNELLTDWIRQ